MPGERRQRINDAPQITMTVRQFAKAAGVTKNTVFNWIQKKQLRSIKICGTRLIDVEDYRERLRRGDDLPKLAHNDIGLDDGTGGG